MKSQHDWEVLDAAKENVSVQSDEEKAEVPPHGTGGPRTRRATADEALEGCRVWRGPWEGVESIPETLA